MRESEVENRNGIYTNSYTNSYTHVLSEVLTIRSAQSRNSAIFSVLTSGRDKNLQK